jgi:hypothetical protein
LKITEAIKTADTEHVVYFLLTAYVETLQYYDPLRSCLPEHVKRLPMAGMSDVSERLRAVRSASEQNAQSEARTLIEEVFEVFSAAFQRLSALQQSHQFLISWLSLSAPGPHSSRRCASAGASSSRWGSPSPSFADRRPHRREQLIARERLGK